MTLGQLFDWTLGEQGSLELKAITDDSREVKPGDVFFSRLGKESEFCAMAVEKGAIAVVYPSDINELVRGGALYIGVKDYHQTFSFALNQYYNIGQYALIGITGTNGKTSIGYLIAKALDFGYIGTLGSGLVERLSPLANTTPGLLRNRQLLFDFKQQGVKGAVMEVSSHGLKQQRVDGLPFETAVFTQLSHDHLDYHLDMEDYFLAKAKLFRMPGLKHAVINIDCPYGRRLLTMIDDSVRVYTYSLKDERADLFAFNITQSVDGLSAETRTPWGQGQMSSPLVGEFYIANLLCVVASLCLHGEPFPAALTMIKQLSGVPGRMQRVVNAPCVLVDYAHTPDALEKALIAAKAFAKAKLWCVFGCGGDRDKDKRALMGAVASKYADTIIITSDNPRSEAPMAIIEMIKEGAGSACNIILEADRKQAIKTALDNASPQDVILIAGKGHEDYQIIGNTRHHFCDVQTVRQLAFL